MEIRFKKLHPDAVEPFHGSKMAAGYDLTAVDVEWDDENKVLVYHTGIAVEIPRGYAGFVFPRSSIYLKTLMQTNSVGVIDADYRGEILVKYAFRWSGENTKPRFYEIGDRIAQLVIEPVEHNITWIESDTLSETERGAGGYGSTGA
jgi:dUTP pyrophosphatase